MTDKAWELTKAGSAMSLVIMMLAVFIILFARLTEGARIDKLKAGVQNIVGDEWQVGDEIQMQNPISASSSAFALSGEKGKAVAVVMRVETLYGPMPCVYVCEAMQNTALFKGVLSLSGTISDRLMDREDDRGTHPIGYWARRIPQMMPPAVLSVPDAEEKSAE